MALTYVDSSAFTKLITEEPEGEALRAALRDRTLTASVLLEVEVVRAAGRYRPDAVARAQELLSAVSLIELDQTIRSRASILHPPSIRSLDAIHLASALALADELDAFITYDARLADAARAHRLDVLTPS